MSTLVNTPGTAETPGRDAIVHGLVEIGHHGIAIVDDDAASPPTSPTVSFSTAPTVTLTSTI